MSRASSCARRGRRCSGSRRSKVDSPRFNIVRYDAQHFNFSDLIEKFSRPSPKPSSKPAKFSVSNIRIENDDVTFDDRLLKAKHVVDRFALHIPFIAPLPSATEIFVTPLLQAPTVRRCS